MGPLNGIKIVELAGIGPGPFCAMMLSDMGAEVIRVVRSRTGGWGNPAYDVLNRGRRCIALDLKQPSGVAALLRIIEQVDGLQEGFRPGVMERLGLGPEVCLERNPKLVYGRMTGWGQDGPLADVPGHDINYISLAGALHSIGRSGQKPTVPLTLVGDFGGGGLMLAYGMVCALLESSRSGQGQVVDAAMVDGAAALMTIFHATEQIGFTNDERGSNMFDSGAHFYDTYETADGKYISIGSFEPQFYACLLEELGLEAEEFPQLARESWPEQSERLARIFATKTRAEWCEQLEVSDVCFAPVLTLSEARAHPHNRARDSYVEIEGVAQPRPAPRFSRTAAEVSRPPAGEGEHQQEVLAEFGFSAEEIRELEPD